MAIRTRLIPVAGIPSTYVDGEGRRLDVSALSHICFLTPDTDNALHALNIQTKLANGTLYVSDMYRTWAMQAKAYDDWKHGRRKDFASPPGESFHMAGRAIDIDIYNLRFPGSKSLWLEKFWTIALPLNWHPIVRDPDPSLSECWHFQYPGNDWAKLVPVAPDALVAKCAILDSGNWNPVAPADITDAMFLQAQCNRLKKDSMPVLDVDGVIGPKTIGALKTFGLDKHSVADAIKIIVTMTR